MIQRYFLEIEGVVVESKTTSPPRPATYYQIMGFDKIVRQYIAGPTDKSLPRQMPIGTHIKKIKHQLWWERDKVRVDDFTLPGPVTITALGFMLMFWSVSQWHIRRSETYRMPNQAL
jgi:hypothetical protein